MTLEALAFYAEGDVTFHYQDGDLFWRHVIELVMDAAQFFAGVVYINRSVNFLFYHGDTEVTEGFYAGFSVSSVSLW